MYLPLLISWCHGCLPIILLYASLAKERIVSALSARYPNIAFVVYIAASCCERLGLCSCCIMCWCSNVMLIASLFHCSVTLVLRFCVCVPGVGSGVCTRLVLVSAEGFALLASSQWLFQGFVLSFFSVRLWNILVSSSLRASSSVRCKIHLLLASGSAICSVILCLISIIPILFWVIFGASIAIAVALHIIWKPLFLYCCPCCVVFICLYMGGVFASVFHFSKSLSIRLVSSILYLM